MARGSFGALGVDGEGPWVMQVCQVDDGGSLFISPAIDEWAPLGEHGIDTVIDLDGGLDHCIPTVPNQVLYLYFPSTMRICRTSISWAQ